MAISIATTAAAIPRTVTKASPPSFSLSNFSSSSVQFRISTFRSQNLKFNRRAPSLTVVASTKQTFSTFDELLEKSEKPVFVDFYATWCGPCQFMVPILEQVSASLIDKIQVVKIDTEKYPSIANKYSIEALPTFILFKDGKPVDRFEGALAADQLIQRIETSLQKQ